MTDPFYKSPFTGRYCPHLTGNASNSSCNNCKKIWCNRGCGVSAGYNCSGYASWICPTCYNKERPIVKQLNRIFQTGITDNEVKDAIKQAQQDNFNRYERSRRRQREQEKELE